MAVIERQELGVRLIVAYKAAKAVAEVALAAALLALAATGEIETLREVAIQLKEHIASRWSIIAGRALSAVLSTRGVHVVEIGLVGDGILSAIEAWSLWRGYSWAAWLVVAATATPLPLEVIEVARTHRASRVALLVLNVAIVLYLVAKISRKRSDRG